LRALESSRRGLTKNELLDMLEHECSERSLYRDLELLKSLQYPIDSHDGRWVLDPEATARGHALHVSPSEAIALILAEELLAPVGTSWIGASLTSVRKRLMATLTPEGRAYCAELRRNLAATVLAPVDYTDHGPILDAIHQAIEKEHTLRVRHASPGKEPTDRVVEPYLLHYVEGRAYLVADCRNAGEQRKFAVHRMQAAEVLDEAFEPDPGFDAHAFVAQSFGVYQGAVHPFVIDLHPEVAHHARERRWHPTQRVTEREGGWARLSFEASGLPEVAAWVAGYGGKARAIGPVELVDAVATLHREGLEGAGFPGDGGGSDLG
jgi:proteasome accessory factor B